jgi:cell division protein FtsA
MQTERYIAAADLGSSKIALTVAKVEGEDVQVIYYKEVPSDGIRYSSVFNPKRAAAALDTAVKDAEGELGIRILQVVLGLPRYEVRQESASASMSRSEPSSCITREEISSLKSLAIDSYPLENEQKEVIYGAVAQSFSADDELVCASENDVIGVTAENIEGNFKIFIGTQKASSNIDTMLNDIGIAPARKIFIPTAVAQAVLTEGEKENGVALVEVGAGVTSLTIYKGGLLRHYSSIPFGGKSITSDIKYECGFTEKLAENIKLAYGACQPDKLLSLSEKTIQINDDENGTYEQLPVKYLSEIINCRSKEIIDAILYQIQESGFADKLRNGVVLTGGCAELVNFANLFREMSGYIVRLGYPRAQKFSSGGCPGVCETSAAASIGMVLEARKDAHLNCIEEAPRAAETQSGAPALDEDGKGELFSEDNGSADGEVIVPNKERGKKDKGHKIRWTGVLRKKISSQLEGAFDNTVGGLFDSME